jgi:hypothetical protein
MAVSVQKHIIVIAQARKTEALRMACGLTLLDDTVHVFVVDQLDDDAETQEQLDALEFAEVPIATVAVNDVQAMDDLANAIAGSQAVYIL